MKRMLWVRTLFCGAILFLGAWAPAQEKSGATRKSAPARFKLPDRDLFDEGRYVYEQYCLVCHGKNGDGRGEMAAGTGVKPRSFRTGLFKYRSTPTGKLPTTEDLLQTIRNGRTGTAMGMFTYLNEEQLRAVVEYIKFFSRRWRKPENYAAPIRLPPEPVWMSEAAGLNRHALTGKATFEAICATCHGQTGDGKGPLAATLKDVTGEPSQPADLRQAHLRSGDEPIDIYRVLMTGLDGTPMASFAEALSADQKWDVVAYILTLRGTAK